MSLISSTTPRLYRAAALLIAIGITSSGSAEVRYVNVNSTNPVSPYLSWETAARVIQEAVDVAGTGDEIVVTNGVYSSGGRAVHGILTNRVALTKAVVLRSINGPAFTIIQGQKVPGSTNGDNAVRCAYLTNGAVLSGFTLTNGATRGYGAGFFYNEDCGGGVWCETNLNTTISNCVVVGNVSSAEGGGAFYGTFINCSFLGNATGYNGGAAQYSRLTNCTLTGNSAETGAGLVEGAACNCTFLGNSSLYAGGAYGSTLNNCLLALNNGWNGGGGAYNCDMNNCTMVGNTTTFSSTRGGGGAYGGTLYNCLLYYNSAPAGTGSNYNNATLNYCCTLPLPTNGTGNITNEPQLSSLGHLSSGSPCIGAGSAAYASGFDLDGEAWSSRPSIGCDEFYPGNAIDSLSVRIQADNTNVGTAFAANFTGIVAGRTTASYWNFGDGTVISNSPLIGHSWSVPGDYLVKFTTYNSSNPAGVAATQVVHVAGAYYVVMSNSAAAPPYSSWATAAASIQDAIDAAYIGATILVSNGVYQVGGRRTQGLVVNRVAITRPLKVLALNGPAVTTILGGYPIRCAYLTNGGLLAGFTLTGGRVGFGDFHDDFHGGAAWGTSTNAVFSNCVFSASTVVRAGGGGGVYGGTCIDCVITGNSTPWGSDNVTPVAGGAYQSTLINCVVTSNGTDGYGGAAKWCNLINCTVDANYGGVCGGVVDCTVINSIVCSNANNPVYGPNSNWMLSSFSWSCTTPDPGGMGNITVDPMFIDEAGGDYRLQANSPCINSGNNASVTRPTDLDSLPRIVGGTVDIGAYEYQGNGSTISYAWLQEHGLPVDGSADFLDSDLDGLNNWQEWRSNTDPTNALSALRLLPPQSNGSNVVVAWQSMPGISYSLLRSAALSPTPAFSPLATNISGQTNITMYTDTNTADASRFFYRVSVGDR